VLDERNEYDAVARWETAFSHAPMYISYDIVDTNVIDPHAFEGLITHTTAAANRGSYAPLLQMVKVVR
jgi:hypothetical protein